MSAKDPKVKRTNIVITDEMLETLCDGVSSPKTLIKHVLLIKGMMYKDLAEDMGHTTRFIGVLLNEKSSLGAKILYEACIALGINPVIVFHKWADWMLEKEKKKHFNKVK